MRHSVGYVINKTQAIIEFDKDIFEEIAENRSETYEYIQTFDDNNIIEYNSIVIHCTSDHSKSRLDTVAEIYGISPNEVRTYGDRQDYLFRLAKPLQKAGAVKMGKVLEQLYMAEARYFTFFKPDTLLKITDLYLNQAQVYVVGEWIDNSRRTPIHDVRNIDKLNEAMQMDPESVLAVLKRTEKIDRALSIIVGYGGVLDYVLRVLKSTEATYKFFREHFDIDFKDTYESMEQYMTDGIGVLGDGIIALDDKLMILDDKGDSEELTDFQVSVHYKIRRGSDVAYVVSLIKSDAEVKQIEWPMSFSEQKIAEFVSSFGPFHINTSKENLRRFHSMLSSALVPDITVYEKYGKNKYGDENIIIFKDHVYSLDRRIAIPRMANSKFYFVDGINGIKVEGKGGTDIDEMLSDEAPSMGGLTTRHYDEYHSVVKQVFQDTTGDLLLMTICTWLGHMVFEPEQSCPMFFTTGITGSGKTTYAKYLCSFFGIKKPFSIEGSTPFPLRISLTLLNQLPLFFNEYRSKMSGAAEKISILKSLFDGTAFKRGKKDLTVETHTFSSFIFMEGEELPESGATRSRSIIWKIKKSGQGSGSPEDILKENRELFGTFIYSYFRGATRELYEEAMKEAKIKLGQKGGENRILDNVSLMYASSVAFCPERKEEFLKVCQEVYEKQMEDFNNNGTIAEIVNIISKYLGYRYAKIYVDGYSIVLSWNHILDFIEKSRLTTELKANSYRDHCEAFGIESGFFTVKSDDDILDPGSYEMMVDGLRIPMAGIDKRFLCNQKVFGLWRDYNNARK